MQISGVIAELVTAIRRIRKYFSVSAKEEIIEKFTKMICPEGKTDSALVFICNLMPNKGRGECTWVPLLLELLEMKQRNLNVMINVMACLGTSAKHYPEFY